MLVTGNETNNERTFGIPNDEPYVKDGIDRAVVHSEVDAVNPAGVGTKAAVHHRLLVPAGGSSVVRVRLSTREPGGRGRQRAPGGTVRRLRAGDERASTRGG